MATSDFGKTFRKKRDKYPKTLTLEVQEQKNDESKREAAEERIAAGRSSQADGPTA
jgi:hypothetical protein